MTRVQKKRTTRTEKTPFPPRGNLDFDIDEAVKEEDTKKRKECLIPLTSRIPHGENQRPDPFVTKDENKKSARVARVFAEQSERAENRRASVAGESDIIGRGSRGRREEEDEEEQRPCWRVELAYN